MSTPEPKPKKETTRKPRKEKDPDAPKHPSSGYVLYCSSIRKELMQENPDLTFADIGKVMGERYKALTDEEKRPFLEQAKELREKYNVAHAEYEARKKTQEAERPSFPHSGAAVGGLFLDADVTPRVREGLWHLQKAWEMLGPVFSPAWDNLAPKPATTTKRKTPASEPPSHDASLKEETEVPKKKVQIVVLIIVTLTLLRAADLREVEVQERQAHDCLHDFPGQDLR